MMRQIPMPEYESDEAEEDDKTVGFADWRESPGTVLETVDDLLEPFGLEIVAFDTGGDTHMFRIEKRAGGGGDPLGGDLASVGTKIASLIEFSIEVENELVQKLVDCFRSDRPLEVEMLASVNRSRSLRLPEEMLTPDWCVVRVVTDFPSGWVHVSLRRCEEP